MQVTCSKNQRYVDLVESVLWPTLRSHLPTSLDDQDRMVLSWAYCLWYLVWCDFATPILETDASLVNNGTASLWAQVMSSRDIQSLLAELEEADSCLVHSPPATIINVAADLVKVLPFPKVREVSFLLRSRYSFPAKPAYGSAELPNLRRLRSVLCFLSRITLSNPVRDALEEWSIREETLNPKFFWELESASNRHPGSALPRKAIRSCVSSGAVADKPGLRGRIYEKLDTEAPISRKCAKTAAQFSLRWPGSDVVRPLDGRLILVPKSWKTRRVIIEEPLTTNWLQASTQLSLQLATAMRWGPTCDPRDPTWNREIITYDPDYCTIDLKQASDSVTCCHVVNCLPPEWRRLVLGARTPTVNVNGAVRPLRKFAGMGNAHTFPVQMNVFACILHTVLDKSPARVRGFGVVGDDIVCHHAVFDDVCDQLVRFGFIVNESKTFGPQFSFKESCGVEVYCQSDVSPLRLSRKFHEAVTVLGDLRPHPANSRVEQVAASALVSMAASFREGNTYPIISRYLFDNLRRRGARFSQEPSCRWDENRMVYYHTVLTSPTAEGSPSRSFGPIKGPKYYGRVHKRDLVSGHAPIWALRAGHFTNGGRERSEATLQWALSSSEGPYGEAYLWLHSGLPLFPLEDSHSSY